MSVSLFVYTEKLALFFKRQKVCSCDDVYVINDLNFDTFEVEQRHTRKKKMLSFPHFLCERTAK